MNGRNEITELYEKYGRVLNNIMRDVERGTVSEKIGAQVVGLRIIMKMISSLLDELVNIKNESLKKQKRMMDEYRIAKYPHICVKFPYMYQGILGSKVYSFPMASRVLAGLRLHDVPEKEVKRFMRLMLKCGNDREMIALSKKWVKIRFILQGGV